jgi:plastocyanin
MGARAALGHGLLDLVALVGATALIAPTLVLAQKGDLTHGQPASHEETVDFGVLPTAPLGPPPCIQVSVPPNVIGGPTDPCHYKNHVLTPEEVTIFKGGEVTFQIHGGGHAMAIYEVSKNTTRDQIGQFLCPGTDPGTIGDRLNHPCNGATAAGIANAAAAHTIEDGKGNVVIVAAANPAIPPNTAVHPDNRVWSVPGRLMSAGGHQFLNGGTIPAGPTSNGEFVTYQFLKTGRYLVVCINRSHLLNDWMFGFVNVVGGN